MRKVFLIILVPLALVVLLLICTPYLMTLFGIDKPLTEYVLARLAENTEQKISINQIQFGLGKVIIGDLTLVNQKGKIQFTAHGLMFYYNVFSFLNNLDQPQRSITNIYLLDPVVTVKPGMVEDSTAGSSTDSSGISLAQILDQFDNVDRINLKNGRIILENRASENLVLGQNLNGWLRSATTDSIDIMAEGGLFSAPGKNFSISVHFNKTKKHLSAEIDIKNLSLKDFDFSAEKGVSFKQGLLNGKVQLFSPDLEQVIINGPLVVTDGEVTFKDWRWNEINAQVTFINNEVQIKDGICKMDGDQALFQVHVPDILKPEISGVILSDDINLNHLVDHMQLGGINHGTLSLSARFKTENGKVKSDIDIQAPEIVLQSQYLKDIQANLTLTENSLEINNLSAVYYGYFLNSSGSINVGTGDYDFQLKAERSFEKHNILDRISQKLQRISLAMLGNIKAKQVTGIWDYFICSPNDTAFTFSGDVKLEDGNFQFLKHKSQIDNFSFLINITDIFNQPSVNYGFIEDPPVHLLSSLPMVENFVASNHVEGLVSGPLNHLNLQVTIQNKNRPEKQFILSGQVRDLLQAEKQMAGDITYQNFSGKYAFILNENQLKGSLTSDSYLQAKINLDFTTNQIMNTLIDFDGFRLSNLFEKDSLTELGEISGSIRINGLMAHPIIQAALNGDRFVRNNIGYYRFDLILNADSSLVLIDSLKVYLNNTPVLKGHVMVDLNRDHINLSAGGSQVNFEDIVQTFNNQSAILTGTTDYEVQITGDLTRPKTSVELNITNGKVYDIPFDELGIAVQDSMLDSEDYMNWTNHVLIFQKIIAIKRGLYHLESNGILPLSENGPLRLALKFNGDILSFIPKLDRFFTDGASFSDINLEIGGTPANPKIEQGRIEIDRGELWLASVADHVQHIRGLIEKTAGSNKVFFRNFHAEVNDHALDINTVENILTSNSKKLESWYFKELDLDFGILSLATSPGGVRLQIPGLMAEGEQGDLELSGKTEKETFYFAGPVGHPNAWGKVVFSNSHFSFPFPPGDSEHPGVVVQFLKTINWDVNVFPGVDLLYVRTIPAFLGEVNAEINVDPESEGLHFTGIIEDNTFRPTGKLHSSRGRLEYLDQNFRVESYGIIFDRSNELPEVYGRAWTSVRDSVGAVPKTVYLELYAIDRETGQNNYQARWEDFRFRLVSADPTIGESQEQVLAYLGYSVDKIKEKATTVGGAVTENYVIRPLLRPIERRLERYLGFDFVRFNSRIAKNIFQVGLSQWYGPAPLNNSYRYPDTFAPYLILLESSELTLGKYLAKNLYITYTGQLIANSNPNQSDFSFNHSFGVEYRFLKNLLLEFEYDRETLFYNPVYTEKQYLEDFKIRLRHSFSF